MEFLCGCDGAVHTMKAIYEELVNMLQSLITINLETLLKSNGVDGMSIEEGFNG
ncbi:MAG: hypothetical protein ACOX2A_11025 [Tepidanaerobacteraceae bacterium]